MHFEHRFWPDSIWESSTSGIKGVAQQSHWAVITMLVAFSMFGELRIGLNRGLSTGFFRLDLFRDVLADFDPL